MNIFGLTKDFFWLMASKELRTAMVLPNQISQCLSVVEEKLKQQSLPEL